MSDPIANPNTLFSLIAAATEALKRKRRVYKEDQAAEWMKGIEARRGPTAPGDYSVTEAPTALEYVLMGMAQNGGRPLNTGNRNDWSTDNLEEALGVPISRPPKQRRTK